VLIEAVQSDYWWEGVTVPLLELVRIRLRDLVQHIDPNARTIVYSNFTDELGVETEHDLPQVGEVDFVRFKQKARAFLRSHEDHISLHKLRQGKPLTATDLAELEAMLLDAGIGDASAIARARETSDGFGRFVRSLVGLDRQAANAAFGELISDGTATAEQIEFIDMIIKHLTEQGLIDPKLLYDSPFTDVAPQGPEQVFDLQRTNRLFKVIDEINQSAVA
jgi:type I restriction enzyme, R subunit